MKKPAIDIWPQPEEMEVGSGFLPLCSLLRLIVEAISTLR
jgi:hypothetical protein